MNKFLAIAIAAVAANVANLFVASALVAFVAAIGMIYLVIYGTIMFGVGLSNSILMLTRNKTLTENMNAGGDDYGWQNAQALGAGFGCVSLMVFLVALGMIGVGIATAAAIFVGLAMLFVLVLGYKAKLFRDGKLRNHNI